MAAKCHNVTVHLWAPLSGDYGSIHCKEQSSCNIYCHEHGSCDKLEVFVYGEEVQLDLHCDEDQDGEIDNDPEDPEDPEEEDDILCPMVWYLDDDVLQSEQQALGPQFDNTQLFRDNTGLVLNDEMYDIGRDWVLNGDFNFNIEIRNYGDSANKTDFNVSGLIPPIKSLVGGNGEQTSPVTTEVVDHLETSLEPGIRRLLNEGDLH